MHSDIEKSLDWRYAVKRFDAGRSITDADWQTLRHALVKAPSSYGLQPWKFLVIESAELRARLREVSWGQSAVTDASKFVVFLSRESVTEKEIDRFMARVGEVRGVSQEALAGYRGLMMTKILGEMTADQHLGWTQRQAYIAMGFLLQTAALLKVDAVPMEGLDPVAYDRLLGLEGTGWRSVVAVALGYRHEDDANQKFPKVRFPETDLIEVR